MRKSLVFVSLALFLAPVQIGCSGDDEGGSGEGNETESRVFGDESVEPSGQNSEESGDSTGGTAVDDPSDPADDAGETPEPDEPDLSEPDAPTCAETDSWDPAWAQLEQDVLDAVNVERAAGATCGGQSFGPAEPLVMDPALRCASRLHSKDMADRNYFSHDTPDGVDPWARIDAAGFTGAAAGENIAAGRDSGEATVEQWMNSSGHCSNIMNPDFEFIGVGYYPGGDYGHLWTQTFGRSSWR